MTDNVISLRGHPVQPSAPVEHVVEFAEELLRDAKAGKIRSLAAAWCAGEQVGTGYRFEATSGDLYLLNGVVPVLQHRICAFLSGHQDEVDWAG